MYPCDVCSTGFTESRIDEGLIVIERYLTGGGKGREERKVMYYSEGLLKIGAICCIECFCVEIKGWILLKKDASFLCVSSIGANSVRMAIMALIRAF